MQLNSMNAHVLCPEILETRHNTRLGISVGSSALTPFLLFWCAGPSSTFSPFIVRPLLFTCLLLQHSTHKIWNTKSIFYLPRWKADIRTAYYYPFTLTVGLASPFLPIFTTPVSKLLLLLYMYIGLISLPDLCELHLWSTEEWC